MFRGVMYSRSKKIVNMARILRQNDEPYLEGPSSSFAITGESIEQLITEKRLK